METHGRENPDVETVSGDHLILPELVEPRPREVKLWRSLVENTSVSVLRHVRANCTEDHASSSQQEAQHGRRYEELCQELEGPVVDCQACPSYHLHETHNRLILVLKKLISHYVTMSDTGGNNDYRYVYCTWRGVHTLCNTCAAIRSFD